MSDVSLYDILGVSNNANYDDIKRAYKEKAQRAHPDKPGGDAKFFKKLQKAYNVLRDKKLRSEYDEFGIINDRPNRSDELAKNNLLGVFDGILRSGDLSRINIVDKANAILNSNLNKARRQIPQLNAILGNINDLLNRVSCKNSNLFALLLEKNKTSCINTIGRVEQDIDTIERSIEMLKEYKDSLLVDVIITSTTSTNTWI